jgi:hypothetical protein
VEFIPTTSTARSDMYDVSDVFTDVFLADQKMPSMLGTAAALTGPSAEGADLSIESVYVPACHNFSVGNAEKMEFYSPNYPNNYANHSDCIKVLRGKSTHAFSFLCTVDAT